MDRFIVTISNYLCNVLNLLKSNMDRFIEGAREILESDEDFKIQYG